MPLHDEPILVVDSAEYRQDLVEVDDVRVGFNVPAAVAAAMRATGLDDGRPVGLAGRESLLLSSYRILASELGREPAFADADAILESLRRRKSEAELRIVRHAADVGVQCMTRLMEAIEPGRTEGHVVGEGMRAAAQLGAFPYDIAVASGPHSGNFQWARLPSWDTERPLEPGDPHSRRLLRASPRLLHGFRPVDRRRRHALLGPGRAP